MRLRVVAVAACLLGCLALAAAALPAAAAEKEITCSLVEGSKKVPAKVKCSGIEFEGTQKVSGVLIPVYAAISLFLTLMAGLMSGLTMGLLSLDQMNLQILKAGGSTKERKYARQILPIVKKHHLLLVTLLLGNAACLEALPIFLDRLPGITPAIAVILSVTAVLFFGEIVPQAVCTRFGLAIGANMAWFVKILMALLFPITWPISVALDKLLGEDHQPFYRRAELKELITMHTAAAARSSAMGGDDDGLDGGEGGDGEGEKTLGGLTHDESTIIRGALDMKAKTVKDCMTPLHAVFMLSRDDVMDRDTMITVLKSGHSRVPVFDGDRQNVRGQMLVKTLILLDPKQATPVSDIPLRSVPKVSSSLPLYDMLNEFQTGQSHLVTVHAEDDVNRLVGIITIEDVIEELIQEEIVDETDVFVDVEKRIRVARMFQTIAAAPAGAPGAPPAGAAGGAAAAAAAAGPPRQVQLEAGLSFGAGAAAFPSVGSQQSAAGGSVSLNADDDDDAAALVDAATGAGSSGAPPPRNLLD